MVSVLPLQPRHNEKAVRGALEMITLEEMTQGLPAPLVTIGSHRYTLKQPHCM